MPVRGEIWWVQLDPVVGSEIAKTRPYLILTANVLNSRRRTVVVVPLSSSAPAQPPLTVPVACAGRTSIAVIDQIRAVSKIRLAKRIGAVSAEDMGVVESALRSVLDLA